MRLKKIIDSGVDLEFKNNFGNTALFEACYHLDSKLALLLLEHGADYTKMGNDDKGPLTIAHLAYINGLEDVLDEIIKRSKESKKISHLVPIFSELTTIIDDVFAISWENCYQTDM